MSTQTRELVWDGYLNVRDLGGLPSPLSRNGETVRGRVVRGPRRELLTVQGWRALRAHGIRTVVDLRNADEIGARDGDPAVEAEARAGIEVVRTPTEDPTDPQFEATCGPILDSPEYWAHNLRLLPGLVAGALRAIATAGPGGVLVHCAAGRDRTGMISSLLLAHAGVPPEVVADDHEISVRAMAAQPAHAVVSESQAGSTPAELDAWVVRTRPFVVELASGDVSGRLRALGLTDHELALLRLRLVEG